MIDAAPNANALSFEFMEGSLTFLAIALAVTLPRLGESVFAPIERAFSALARRRTLAVVVVGLSNLVLRLSTLPWLPIPKPFVPDDFSFLLAADTFAHFRLTNPTPALWQHFESLQIDILPTYCSMYFPAGGMVLAFGQLFLGHPWFGLLLVTAVTASAITWMLQAWLPSRWALLGGLIFVLRLGLFSYWINTYTGAAMIAVLGGALVFGAFPRLKRHLRHRDALLLALGIVILLLSRPYEGLLLCLPILVALIHWIYRKRPDPGILLRRAALPIVLILAGVSWLGYYDKVAFGSPTTLPYTINRQMYAMAPYYIWQHSRPEPVYRHQNLRDFYFQDEQNTVSKIATNFAIVTTKKAFVGIRYFTGFLLMLPLILIHRVFRDRRTRLLTIGLLLLACGMFIEIFLIPHYLAPFAAAFYALGLQAMRHLRAWNPGGRSLVRWITVSIVLLAAVRPFGPQLGIVIPKFPVSTWAANWFGPDDFGRERAAVAAQLNNLPGRHIVFVRYAPHHEPMDEWIANAAEIPSAKVLWVQEMSAAENQQLLRQYPGRSVWLVQPDASPVLLQPLAPPQ